MDARMDWPENGVTFVIFMLMLVTSCGRHALADLTTLPVLDEGKPMERCMLVSLMATV